MTQLPSTPFRRGHTLTELMVVITFFSLLMVMATRLIVVMYGSERTARHEAVAAIGLDRLTHQFQRDVRSAAKILYIRQAPTVEDDLPPPWAPGQPKRAVILRLQVARSVVEYLEANGSVVRIVVPEGPRTTSESEQFRLPRAARVVVQGDPSSGTTHRVLALTVQQDEAEARPKLTVQAVVGGDLRFVQPAAKEGR